MASTKFLRERCNVAAYDFSGDGEASFPKHQFQSTDQLLAAAEANDTQQQLQSLLMALGILCSLVIIMFRFLYLWEQYSTTGTSSPMWLTVQVSLLLGIEACLLAMAVLLALIVPPLIVTWTTALVFDFIFRHLTTIFGTTLAKTDNITVFSTSDDRLRRNSMRIAKEMLGLNAAGVGFVALCFIATIYLRNYLSDRSSQRSIGRHDSDYDNFELPLGPKEGAKRRV
ncbi:hypothetical protein R1sor_003525 [Riccia sorocarpa]|uniref:Uncharacterized protein n=1 Tax=Riccia sorocarpa TaxID=122646 RepID=A0ABD3H1U1_9MARC